MVKKQNISIASIAKQLQVAPSTVSRALNGSKSISEERTRQIKELAQKLNYVPNQMARNLKSGRRNTIAVVVPLISRSFFATVIEGIEDYASAKGYDVIIAQSKNLVETEQRLMSKLSGKVDGVIASLAGQDASHEYYNALNVPLVQFDRTSTDINAVSVRINDFMGAKTATQHLLDQGFRRIYHLCGLQYVSIWYDRQQGYLAAMHEHGLRIPGQWIFQGAPTEERGGEFARDMIARNDIPEALFCSGDYVALGAIKEFQKQGLAVPAIVGFANEPFCEVIEPALSSVDQFGSIMGHTACEMLIDLIDGKTVENKVIEPKLIIRKSSIRSEKQ